MRNLCFLMVLSVGCASPPAVSTENAPPAESASASPGASQPTSAPGSDPGEPGTIAEPAPADADGAASCLGGSELVHFATPDGVRLEADLHRRGSATPVAVLLHMIPPGNDRSNYPSAFIDGLLAEGWSVLNVDRRGAGGSQGQAREAYRGPHGADDVRGAVDFLRSHRCGFSLERWVIVGASNGTTSALDYAVQPGGGRPAPSGLVFLTAGRYTEAQNRLAEVRARIPPILFVWGRAEAPAGAFIETIRGRAPAGWAFQVYAPGAHGTRVFGPNPESIPAIVGWIAMR